MLRELMTVKDVFYDILSSGEDEGQADVSAVQKMGVGITKAVQREGNVVILQNQSVVQKKVVTFAVDGLRKLDRLIHDEHIKELDVIDVKEIEAPKEKPVAKELDLREVCKVLLSQGVGFADFKKLMSKVYLETVMLYSKTMSEAAAKVHMQQTNFKNSLVRYKVEINFEGGEKNEESSEQ